MEHPFAPYIQMLGKGKNGSRDLTQQEAETALALILSHQVEPIQLGAFLMLMRVKEETPAEIAGFTRAAQSALSLPPNLTVPDLDWPCYAGKRRQLPWHVLSALLLASQGIKVLMHGIDRGSAGRLYAPQALSALGIPPCASPSAAAQQLDRHHFAYLPLGSFSPMLESLLDLKSTLGLRSPLHTVVRMLNPLRAPASLIGIFHPGYDDTHQQAAVLLGWQQLAVFKGEGGEPERNPDTDCQTRLLERGAPLREQWPALFTSRHLKETTLDAAQLGRLWRGEIDHEYGAAAVTATAALALRATGRAATPDTALELAQSWWQQRDRDFLDTLRD